MLVIHYFLVVRRSHKMAFCVSWHLNLSSVFTFPITHLFPLHIWSAPDNEPEILDVYCELMMAAQEILAGGAGNRNSGATKAQVTLGAPPLTSVIPQGSLMAMAARGGCHHLSLNCFSFSRFKSFAFALSVKEIIWKLIHIQRIANI